jgi:hypothetical protein
VCIGIFSYIATTKNNELGTTARCLLYSLNTRQPARNESFKSHLSLNDHVITVSKSPTYLIQLFYLRIECIFCSFIGV